MPELPEVQTTVNGINRALRGLKIVDVWTDYPVKTNSHKEWISSEKSGHKQIKNEYFFKKFKKDAVGAKIVDAKRRAKNVLINLDNNKTVLVHMKMTGHLLYGKYKRIFNSQFPIFKKRERNIKKPYWVACYPGPLRDDSYNQFIHLVFTLSNGKHLVLSDVRKFAKVTILPTNELKKEFADTGPEPLDKNFQFSIFNYQINKKPGGKIKQVLMDQAVLAGIGNIYSDEVLWASNVNPLRNVEKLKEFERRLIFQNIKKILKKGIEFKGDSLSDYRNLDGKKGKFQYEHKVYQRKGKECLKKGCSGIIKRIVVGGRSTHFCPLHQK